MIVVQVRGQKPLEVPFIKHDDMVQKFSANAAYDALNIGVLPG